MQPNEQEPTPPPATPPAQLGGSPDAPVSPPAPTPAAPPQTPPGTIAPSFATPDFFQLDPIVDPMLAVEAKKRKKKILIIAAIVAAVFAVMAFLGYLLLLYNSPQERFYRVLEKQLNVPYITEDITLKGDGISSETSVSYDFSGQDGTLYSAKYKYSAKDTLQVEEVHTAKDKTSVRVLKGSDSLGWQFDGVPVKIGTWYNLPLNDGGEVNRTHSTGLYYESRNPVLILGKLSENERSRVLNYLRSVDAYDVKSSRGIVVNSQNQTVYTVAVDISKVLSSNATLAGRQDDKTASSIVAGVKKNTEFIFTVNDSTSLVEGIEFKLNKNVTQGNSYTSGIITMHYPDKSNVKEISNEHN